MHQSLQEDEGLLFYIWKRTFISSTSRYLRSICWLNATTSELVYYLLTCVPHARRGWGGKAAFTSARILRYQDLGGKSCRSHFALTSTLPFSSLRALATQANSSPAVYFVSNLPPTPLPFGQPANHSTLRTKIRFQDVVTFFSMALLTVSLPYRVGMTVMGAIQKSGTENPFK